MFYWKHLDIDPNEIKRIQNLYRPKMPKNMHFFQALNIPLTEFLGHEVQRFVLIQVAPRAEGRIHTDWRPTDYGDQLALQIPLDNCDEAITEMWESSYDPPVQYTDNGQPYRFFDPEKCRKVTEFRVTKPVLFRTDIPHSVSNPGTKPRRAISVRFKKDPWEWVNE